MSTLRPWSAFARRATGRAGARPVAGEGGSETTVAFRCNLCGRANEVPPERIGREVPSCAGCGSTVRFRAIARLVTREVLRSDAALCDVPPARRIRGLGLSDAAVYAKPLARVFSYENTYLHAKPRLDILDIPAHRRGTCDFLIASDVFEHVAPPVAVAFRNARALLADGGVFVFSVPFTLADETVEHFPDLHDWRLEQRDGRCRVINRTRDGRVQVFDNPVFHGGPGTTLEMRVFCRAALLRHLAEAGFGTTRIADEPCAAFGIAWPERFSVPMVACAQ
jgi:SAM-dependent methyltransferase